jgi:enterochelin esterase-like enzyme
MSFPRFVLLLGKPFFMARIVLLFLCFSFLSSLSAQHEKADRIEVYSENLQEQWTVWVSLPRYYEENDYRCHLVIHLDAQEINQANTIRTIRDELFENGGYIQPVILVGVEQKNRRIEMNPNGETGIAFRKFLTQELIPFIDSTYRTYPDRIISGHSLGGYYALDLWRRCPEFKNCFAFSPAVYNDNNRISAEIADYLKTAPKGFVYFNHGDQGNTENEILKVIPALEDAFLQHKQKETDYLYKAYPGYGHNFTHLVGFTDAMLAYFGRFSPPDADIDALWDFSLEPISYMENFHKELSDWLEFPIPQSVDLISNLIGTYLEAGKQEKAQEMANYILLLEPENPYVLWSAAQAYSETEPDKSRNLYLKALNNFEPHHVFENSTNSSIYDFLKEMMLEELKTLLGDE